MSGVNLMELIRKRHDGPAWIVVDEVGNGTGSNVKRHADAVALGIWPSHGYEIHGYELKASRGDVQKELRDPSKADAVGKFCDYWWLAITDEAIIDGLTIPPTWGILAPKNRVLRAIRKAPKRADVTPVTRAFVAALTRRVVSGWVPRAKHEEDKQVAAAEALATLKQDREWKNENAVRELAELKDRVATFEEETGVKIGQRWDGGNIARAVSAVLRARELGKPWINSPAALARAELHHLERTAAQHQRGIAEAADGIERVKRFIAELEVDERPPASRDASHSHVAADDPELL